jgi:hypothetical protein
MGRYNVVVGDDFEIEAFEVEDAEDVFKLSGIAERHAHQRMRERLAYLIFGAIFFALVIAVAIGFYDGSFDEVSSVWSAAALPLGYVLKAYFDGQESDVGQNGSNAPKKG